MFPTFKKWFIPSEGNDYRPHFLRAFTVALLVVLVGVTFLSASTIQKLLTTKGSFLAAVVSSVLVDLTNGNRANEGLSGLSVNPVLVATAQLKADDMAEKGYFAHNTPDGKTPWYWFQQTGYNFAYAGENLAVFFGDSKDVIDAWMNSPSHRANILNSNFTEIGIATAEGIYQGQKTIFVVQEFGTPAVTRPIATLTSQTVPANNEDTTVGEVGGETAVVVTEANSEVVPPQTTIVHEDDTFIAVRNDAAEIAPSAISVIPQSTSFERLVASPRTLLSYVYAAIAGIVGIALVLLVFLELRVQRPRTVVLAFFLLAFIGALFFLMSDNVVVAEVHDITQQFLGSSV